MKITWIGVLEGGILSAVDELIRVVEEKVRPLVQPILGQPLERAGFVDGSYALDERRGVYVLALSAATVVVDGSRLEKTLHGSAKPVITLLVPKSYGESRASLLMSIYELLAAIDLVRRGVDAVFLDGSYVSDMMVPFGYARNVHEDFVKMAGAEVAIAESYGKHVAEQLRELASSEPRSAVTALLRELVTQASRLYEELGGAAPDLKLRKEALDYAVVYVEMTAYLAALKLLLEECSDKGVAPLWVAKDAESRYIVEREGVVGWLNDLTLLDYAWREEEAVYTCLEGVKFGRPKPCAVWRSLLEEVYERWGSYCILYFKLRRFGPVSQITYPGFVPRERALKALATLLELSDRRGYPRPLSYVHHMAVLNPDFARVVADELYRRERNPIARSMLAPSGRARAGLR